MTIQGIDVASYQGSPNWPAVAAAGYQFALIKATEGLTYVNPTFNDAPLWLAGVSLTNSAMADAQPTVELVCRDAWHVLAAWRPRRLYLWSPNSNTVLQIIQWLLARSGIPLVTPGSPSTQLSREPAFAIQPSMSGAHALHALLDMVPEVLLFTSAGAVLVNPQPNDTPAYSHTPTSHPILASRITTSPQSIEDVLVFGQAQNTDTTTSLMAEAVDQPAGLRGTPQPFQVADMQLRTASDAQDRANLTLRKAQYMLDAGEIATVPNVGLELWDVLSLTDTAAGWSANHYRVRAINTRLDYLVDGGIYTQSTGLMYT